MMTNVNSVLISGYARGSAADATTTGAHITGRGTVLTQRRSGIQRRKPGALPIRVRM